MSLVLSVVSIVIISKVVISNAIIDIVDISAKDIMYTQTTRTLPKHDDVSAIVVTFLIDLQIWQLNSKISTFQVTLRQNTSGKRQVIQQLKMPSWEAWVEKPSGPIKMRENRKRFKWRVEELL